MVLCQNSRVIIYHRSRSFPRSIFYAPNPYLSTYGSIPLPFRKAEDIQWVLNIKTTTHHQTFPPRVNQRTAFSTIRQTLNRTTKRTLTIQTLCNALPTTLLLLPLVEIAMLPHHSVTYAKQITRSRLAREEKGGVAVYSVPESCARSRYLRESTSRAK